MMNDAELDIARTKLKTAERLLKEKRLLKARDLLEEIAALEYNLDRNALLEKAEKLRKQVDRINGLRKSRWVLVATASIVAVALAAMVGLRQSSTLVAFDIHASRLKLVPSASTEIGTIPLKSINLSGIQNLRLGRAVVDVATQFDKVNGNPIAWKRLTNNNTNIMVEGSDPLWSVSIQSSYLRLTDLTVSENSSMVFEGQGTLTGVLNITVSSDKTGGVLDVAGKSEMTCNECQLCDGLLKSNINGVPIRLQLASEQIEFLASKSGIIMSLMFDRPRDSAAFEVGRHIPVSSLEFTKLTGNRLESSIVDKSRILLMELGGKEINVQSGDIVQIGKLSNFHINQLNFAEHLIVTGYGEVGSLRTGNGNFLKNRMPSYLEWLGVNQAASLFIGTLVSILSLIFGILYRLKILDES